MRTKHDATAASFVRFSVSLIVGLVLAFATADAARADLFTAYVTGESGGSNVIFRATFDPSVAGSAVLTPIITDTLRLDGIDFMPGDPSKVVVGAQSVAGGNGAITHYDVMTGAKLADYISSTNAVTPAPPASGMSRPSTVLSTPTQFFYVENQFGFDGATNRIMRAPFGGPAGTAAVVFDGAAAGALGLKNFEGLEIAGGRLYFFAQDAAAPAFRALYSIGLGGSGDWDGAAPLKNLGMLTQAAGGTDGSDELDFDPVSGKLYGSNVISGEVTVYDPASMTGGFLISPGAIAAAPPGSNLARLGTGKIDGIRATGTGFLVLAGIDGVLMSIDLAGIAANGLDDADVKILYDDAISRLGYRFDDLTPLAVVPEPGVIRLSALAVVVLCGRALARRRRGR